MPSEAQARVAINKLLEDAGWRENIVCEHRIAKKVFSPSADPGAFAGRKVCGTLRARCQSLRVIAQLNQEERVALIGYLQSQV